MHMNETEPARNSHAHLGGVYRMQRAVRHRQMRQNRQKTGPVTTGSGSGRQISCKISLRRSKDVRKKS